MDCVRRTVEVNRLQGRVRSYVSDNLTSIPDGERFDLVVGNPPGWYDLYPKHPAFDLYPNLGLLTIDRGWMIHAGFYSRIVTFLNPGAFVLVQEIEPTSREVALGTSGIPWDRRPEDQSDIFAKMMERGGLSYVGDFELRTPIWNLIKSSVQISRKPDV